MKKPTKPQRGQRALQSIYNTVCDIVDYLPTLEVVGDNKTISVNHSMYGTTIHAIQPNITAQGEKSIYEAGSGLSLSGNTFNVNVDGTTVKIVNDMLSCVVQGGTGGDGDHVYKYYCPDCSLWFYQNDAANYGSEGSGNAVGINPGWLYGDAQCKAGFEAFQRALLLAMSGDYRDVVVATGLDPNNNVIGIKAIGSESVSTWWSQDYPWPSIWVNPNWLSGGTSCQAGYNAITATVNKYLTGLTGEGDTLKKTDTGLSWEQDNNDGGPGGGDDYVFKYADPFNSIVFASNSGSVYNSEDEDEIGSNYIYVNDDWLAGNTPCKAGFMAIQSAILKAMSGDSTVRVIQDGDEVINGIGSESVSTYFNQIWVNPAWLSGGTNCQAGYQAVTGAVAKYLNSLTVAEIGGNTLKKDGSNGFGWYKDNTGTGGDGDHVFKYVDPFDSLVFASNSGSNYTSTEENIGTNHVYVNAQWLAGNTECKAGFDAIQSAVYKYLTQSPTLSTYDSTSCTLKVNPTTNTLYWGEVEGGLPTIPSTGLTSGALVDGNGITTGIALSLSATNTDSVLSCSSNGTISWQAITIPPPTPGDGNKVFKYDDPFSSIIFATNDADDYDSDEEDITANHIYVNADWIAGNTECKEGLYAVSAAMVKSLNALPHDATSCTLKIDNATSALYWGASIPTPVANKVLSANAQGQMTWETNTASGSSGGGGDLSTCYVTTQGEHTVVPNTRYCIIPIASLSTNAIEFPNMDPASISSYETDNYQRIYKYFYNGFEGWNSRPDYMYETITATIDGEEQYGAYDPKNSNWKKYLDGVGVGNIFYFEPQEQDCVVEIDCGIGGNSIAIAPCGLIFSTYSSDVISGTAESWYEAWRDETWPPQYYSSDLQNWRWDLSKGTKYIFIYDHTTNIWSCLQG